MEMDARIFTDVDALSRGALEELRRAMREALISLVPIPDANVHPMGAESFPVATGCGRSSGGGTVKVFRGSASRF